MQTRMKTRRTVGGQMTFPPPSAVAPARVMSLVADATHKRGGAPGAVRNRLSSGHASDSRRLDIASVAHDARNVLAALRLYSELLAEPGVLTVEHRHYAHELHAIASASCGLVEQLAALQPAPAVSLKGTFKPSAKRSGVLTSNAAAQNAGVTKDVAEAVQSLAGLLAAIAGPGIQCEVKCLPCNGAAHISPEDLTRILINLVRNAQEAMPQGGCIRITTQQGGAASFLDGASQTLPRTALICVQDNGPGIAAGVIERIFDSGFSTRSRSERDQTKDWPRAHRRGQGLSIVRALTQTAGGQVRAVSALGKGARFELEFPLVQLPRCSVATAAAAQTFVTGTSHKGQIQC